MSATLSGAIKAHIEAQGLGVPVDRDEAEGRVYPYITVQEGIAFTKDPQTNAYDRPCAVEQVQINLFMARKLPSTYGVGESYALPDQLTRALNAKPLDAAPMKVYGMTVVNRTRIVGPKSIQYAITAEVRRQF